MQGESLPFVAIGAALIAGCVWFVQRYELVRFADKDELQFCKPDVKEGTQRFGRDAAYLTPADIHQLQLVQFRTPRTGRVTLSRVIAVEGQRVEIKAGKVHVDGEELREPYGKGMSVTDQAPELVVPMGCLYVLNDVRQSDRYDSRAFGPIPVGAVMYVFAAKEPEVTR